jgi:hypothetical protein
MDWTAQYCNDPTHDFDLVIEILYKDDIVAMIRYREELELIWFTNESNLCIPVDWLSELFTRAKRDLIPASTET